MALSMKSVPALLAGLVTALSAHAQVVGGTGMDPGSAVAVVVKVPKPWYAPKSVVISRMRDTIPQYRALPGLAYKAFSLAQADGQYGGVYLWKDEAAARAWFNAAWFERVEKERGSKGQVQFYEVPVAIDNTGGVAPEDGEAVATVVTVATPKGVAKAQIVQEFRAAIPAYQKVPGLLRKYFIVTVRSLPRMRHPGAWTPATALRRVRPRQAARVQLQAAGVLPLMRCVADVADRGASGGET